MIKITENQAKLNGIYTIPWNAGSSSTAIGGELLFHNENKIRAGLGGCSKWGGRLGFKVPNWEVNLGKSW